MRKANSGGSQPDRGSTLRMKKRVGRCYEIAFKALVFDKLFDDSARLVHGALHAGTPWSPRPYPHAWIECGGQVWDPVLDKRFSADTYFDRFKAMPAASYTAQEAVALLLQANHYGAWHDDAALGGLS
jgi:hypothetical protein